MSPLSVAVETAGMTGVARKRVPSRIATSDFFTESDRARALFARLVNAPDPVAHRHHPGGLLRPGDRRPQPAGRRRPEHRRDPRAVPGQRARLAAAGARARRGGAHGGAAGRPSRAAATPGTRGCSRPSTARRPSSRSRHVHWTDGTRFDLEAIGRRAREVGAALVIDGTQSVGALPFDVAAIQPDALVCATYKWLMGPYSMGFAYLGPRFDDGEPLEETWIGRAGSENFKELVNYRDDYQPGARALRRGRAQQLRAHADGRRGARAGARVAAGARAGVLRGAHRRAVRRRCARSATPWRRRSTAARTSSACARRPASTSRPSASGCASGRCSSRCAARRCASRRTSTTTGATSTALVDALSR